MNTAELKEESNSWNLASDCKLLNYLQQFSNEITNHIKESSNHINQLSFDINDSETNLKNTFNEFIMLGDTQFIENVIIIYI